MFSQILNLQVFFIIIFWIFCFAIFCLFWSQSKTSNLVEKYSVNFFGRFVDSKSVKTCDELTFVGGHQSLLWNSVNRQFWRWGLSSFLKFCYLLKRFLQYWIGFLYRNNLVKTWKFRQCRRLDCCWTNDFEK